MIVVDTNVISELMRPAPDAHVRLWIGEQDLAELHVTAITLAEIAYGVTRLPAGRRKALITSTADDVIAAFHGRVVAFDEAAVPHYARIVSVRERAGRPVTVIDGQIAAICAAFEATLATRNIKDFKGTGVALIDPWVAT